MSIIHYCKLKHRKSQVEIIGLVIIISLVVLFMLFVFFRKAKSSTSTEIDVFQESKLVSSFVYSILSTDVLLDGNGNTLDLRTILQDCVSAKKIRCFNLNSCDCVEKVLNTTLNNTLDKFSPFYSFIITTELKKSAGFPKDETISVFSKVNCGDDKTDYAMPKADYAMPIINRSNSKYYSVSIVLKTCLSGNE